jgi:hypothetical protein
LAENVQQNFTDVPTFLRFVRVCKRQAIIRRLEKHSKDKAAWIKAEKDYIQGLKLLQKNAVLTLENTHMAIDLAQDKDLKARI